MPMKVIFCTHNYFPAQGGAETTWKNLADRLVRRGHDIRVVTTTARSTEDYFLPGRGRDLLPEGTERIDGVPVTRVPFKRFGAPALNLMRSISTRLPIPGRNRWRAMSWGPRSRAYPRATEALGLNGGVDLIVAGPLPTLVILHARRAAARLGRPLVLVPCFHTEDKYSFDNPLYFQWLREAAGVVCLTELEREYLHRIAGVSLDRLRTIGCGVAIDRTTFLPDDELDAARAAARKAVRARHALTRPGLVLFFGQHVPHKGIIPLLDAMETVWRDGEGAASGSLAAAELIIAGNPSSYTPAVAARIAVLPEKFRARIRLLPAVPEKEKIELLRAADVFVSISPYESFGIVYLEAWREGTAVIACHRGASSRLVEPFRDGLLVEDSNSGELAGAILTLLRDPGLRKRMGMRGRKKTQERFGWEYITDLYEGFFGEVINSGATPKL